MSSSTKNTARILTQNALILLINVGAIESLLYWFVQSMNVVGHPIYLDLPWNFLSAVFNVQNVDPVYIVKFILVFHSL